MNANRQVLYSVAMSLDGFIAGPEGQYDWIPHEVGIDFTAFLDRFDTLLMGRKTFELTLTQGPENQIPGMQRYIFSSQLRAEDHPEVEIVPPDRTTDVVRRLKDEVGKKMWLFGGGHFFSSLLDADLVDEIEVAVIPILLGEGLPLLRHEYTNQRLELLETKEYESGVILSTYRVLREQKEA